MRIDEVILSEKEFGALRRAGKSMANYTAGALGKMGSEVVNSVLNSSDCELVAAIDLSLIHI